MRWNPDTRQNQADEVPLVLFRCCLVQFMQQLKITRLNGTHGRHVENIFMCCLIIYVSNEVDLTDLFRINSGKAGF